MKRFVVLPLAVSVFAIPVVLIFAADPPPPIIDELVIKGTQKNLRVTPAPGAGVPFTAPPMSAGRGRLIPISSRHLTSPVTPPTSPPTVR